MSSLWGGAGAAGVLSVRKEEAQLAEAPTGFYISSLFEAAANLTVCSVKAKYNNRSRLSSHCNRAAHDDQYLGIFHRVANWASG